MLQLAYCLNQYVNRKKKLQTQNTQMLLKTNLERKKHEKHAKHAKSSEFTQFTELFMKR